MALSFRVSFASLLKIKVPSSIQLVKGFKGVSRSSLNFEVRSISSSITRIFKAQKMVYEIIESGTPNGDDYRIYYKNEAGPVSPLHDIPLYADAANNVFNMVVEIPRWTNAKMEIDTKAPLNPIKQDVKNGKLRYVANCFPHHGYIWNYGAFPQLYDSHFTLCSVELLSSLENLSRLETWENPAHVDPHTNHKGDNDPIDVLEIGHRVAKRGEIIQVKILGTIALIDEGETDWKIFTIDVKDPQASQINDINDIEAFFPGLLKASVEWFKIYKIPDGKPENKFAFNGDAKNSEFALNVVKETHSFWKALLSKELDAGKLACSTVTVESSPFKISLDEANEIFSKAPKVGSPKGIDSIVDKWHFLHLK